ncbi:MAG: energy transducer TonB [Bacteroidetes bacterium]|jgi:TonB family protein|nr:energy transducer TonB [Bacteroidota bacterium]
MKTREVKSQKGKALKAQAQISILAAAVVLLATSVHAQSLADASIPARTAPAECLECNNNCDTKAKVLNLQTVVNSIAYPEDLRGTHQEGKVVLKLYVNCLGEVSKWQIISSTHPSFSRAVEERVDELKLLPSAQNGRPMSSWVILPIHFELH